MLCDLRRGARRQVPEGSGDPTEGVLQDQFGRHAVFLQQGVDPKAVQVRQESRSSLLDVPSTRSSLSVFPVGE